MLFHMRISAVLNPLPALHAVDVVLVALERALEVVTLPPHRVLLPLVSARGVELQLVDDLHVLLLLLPLGLRDRGTGRRAHREGRDTCRTWTPARIGTSPSCRCGVGSWGGIRVCERIFFAWTHDSHQLGETARLSTGAKISFFA